MRKKGIAVKPANVTDAGLDLVIENDPVPLHSGSDGVIRVGRTRVTIDTVVAAFEDGSTAEEIAQQYPSLALSDVYAVIGYYLNHRVKVAKYLQKRREICQSVRKENEVRWNPQGLRKRLLARRTKESAKECWG
jgi:uncharacterized protein (DUF433 family)